MKMDLANYRLFKLKMREPWASKLLLKNNNNKIFEYVFAIRYR